MKKNILLITYYWPPSGGAGVQRWLKFVKYLDKSKYNIIVYTPENAESPNQDQSLLQDIPNDIQVLKKPIWEPFEVYKKLTNKKGNFNAGFLNESDSKKNSMFEKLSLFIRANLFIPDAKMFWIRPSVKYLKKIIQDNKIDLIISSGPPHSLHLIAKKLKEKTMIKWLADFRDPWTNIDFYKELPTLQLTDKIQSNKEESVLEESDKVLVIGNEMKREFQEISSESKISVITNGFDSVINESNEYDKKFSITHIGSINADRSHESFFIAVSELLSEKEELNNHLEIKFIGKVDSKARNMITKYNLNKFCTFIPYLPYQEVSDIQNRAHILYLPINNSPNAKGILTGKFFEYLSANRHILAQGPIDGDLALILKETKTGKIFDFKEVDGVKEYISEIFEYSRNSSNKIKLNNIDKYSRKNLTKKLEDIIDELLSNQ